MNRTFCWLCALLTSLLILTAWIPRRARADDGTAGGGGAHFDRLDGHGASGEKVDVIEWQGNLEIHVTPRGSLQGLALKLDKHDQGNPVMVIGYRFKSEPGTQLIRRAVLGIPLSTGFKVYKDPTDPDYDKIIITMNALPSPLVAFRLDPPPKRLYPAGYAAALKAQKTQQAGMSWPGAPSSSGQRVPATQGQAPDGSASPGQSPDQPNDTARHGRKHHDSGTIQPFMMQ